MPDKLWVPKPGEVPSGLTGKAKNQAARELQRYVHGWELEAIRKALLGIVKRVVHMDEILIRLTKLFLDKKLITEADLKERGIELKAAESNAESTTPKSKEEKT